MSAAVESLRPRSELTPQQELEILLPLKTEVFHRKDPVRIRQLEPIIFILGQAFFANRETGILNIKNLHALNELYLSGEKVFIALNHRSHIDHLFLRIFLAHYGSRHLWDNIAIVGRESLWEDWLFRYFLPLVDFIDVISPRQFRGRSREIFKKFGGIMDGDWLKKQIRIWAETINGAAQLEVDKAFSRGQPVGVYVGGQRERTGGLIQILPEISNLLKLADFGVSFAFRGTEKILEPDLRKKFKKDPLGTLYRFVRNLPTPVTLTIGSPYPILKEAGDNELVTLVGRKLAECLPPEEQGFYREKQVA